MDRAPWWAEDEVQDLEDLGWWPCKGARGARRTTGTYVDSIIDGIKVTQVESDNKHSRGHLRGKGILIKWGRNSEKENFDSRQAFIAGAVRWGKRHLDKKKKRIEHKKDWKRTVVKGYSVYNLPDKEEAADLLAQIQKEAKPILKHFGLSYETIKESVAEGSAGFNRGRRIIALNVRQRSDPMKFRKFSAIMSTMIHELAHLRHMNHGPQFRAFDSELKAWAKKRGIYRPGASQPAKPTKPKKPPTPKRKPTPRKPTPRKPTPSKPTPRKPTPSKPTPSKPASSSSAILTAHPKKVSSFLKADRSVVKGMMTKGYRYWVKARGKKGTYTRTKRDANALAKKHGTKSVKIYKLEK